MKSIMIYPGCNEGQVRKSENTKYEPLIRNVCDGKFEFTNQRFKTTLLTAPLLAFNRISFAINRALLTF